MNDPLRPSDPPLDALFAAARARPCDTSRAEYGFETRLLGRLSATRSVPASWAMASWRLIPIFGLCVLGLVLWQHQAASAAQDAEQAAYAEDGGTAEFWTSSD